MRELDLSDLAGFNLSRPEPLALSVGRGRAAAKLLAVMAWPDDEKARNEFLSTLAADCLGRLTPEAVVASAPLAAMGLDGPEMIEMVTREAQRDLTDSMFTPHGGFSAVATAPGMGALSKLVQKAEPGWRATGRILQYVLAIEQAGTGRGGGSVNKAVWVIEKTHHFGMRTRTELMKSWKRYGAVAHLCAAMVRIIDYAEMLVDKGSEPPEQVFAFYEFLHITLGIARHYQKFATTFIPHGQSKPLLDAANLWQVQDSLRLPEVPFSPLTLAPMQLDALATYRAPQAY